MRGLRSSREESKKILQFLQSTVKQHMLKKKSPMMMIVQKMFKNVEIIKLHTIFIN
jgi:hypothetical protein